MADESWTSKYGSVVWAKFKTFPWWPAFVIDPQDLAPTEESYKSAQKLIGKQYCVVFYGDHTTGMIKPEFVKEFNEESEKECLKQKLSARYQKMIVDAIEEAKADIAMPKEKRFSWYFKEKEEEPFIQPVTTDTEDGEEDSEKSDADNDDDNIVKTPKRKRKDDESKTISSHKKIKSEEKPKRGRKKSQPSNKKDDEENDKEQSDNEPAVKEEEDESEEEEEEVEEEDVSVASEESEDKKRKKKKKTTKNDRKRVEKDTPGRKKSNKAIEDDSKEKDIKGKKKVKSETEVPETSSAPPEALSARLERWHTQLSLCNENPTNERGIEVAKKILAKLAAVSVTIQELKDSGVGKMINKLLKHPNAEISKIAETLKQHFIEISKREQSLSSPPSSAPQPTQSTTATSQETTHGSRASVKKVEEFDESLLSEELKQNVVRKRSVQLLTNVVKHMHAALKLEELMSSLFNTTDHDSHANYTEAATRVFCALKEMRHEEVHDLTRALLEDESHARGLLRKVFIGSAVTF